MDAHRLAWKVVRPTRASDEIAAQLRRAVFDGSLQQGDPHRFAEALAVQLRLVGVRMAEVLDALAGLEQMAARLAAENATPADLELLESLIQPGRSLGQ